MNRHRANERFYIPGLLACHCRPRLCLFRNLHKTFEGLFNTEALLSTLRYVIPTFQKIRVKF